MLIKSDYPTAPLGPLLTELSPDAFVVKKSGRKRQPYFLELIEDEPPRRLRNRIRSYVEFFQGGEWEAETDVPFPMLRLICTNRGVLVKVARLTKKELPNYEDSEFIIHLTTRTQLETDGITGPIWERLS